MGESYNAKDVDRKKRYYQAHREEILEKRRAYYQSNKAKILARQRLSREDFLSCE